MAGDRGTGGGHDGTATFGVYSPVVGGFYFGKTLAGIARVLRAAGHNVVAVQTFAADLDRGRFPESATIDTIPGSDCFDGFIIITSALEPGALQSLSRTGKPLILIGAPRDNLAVPSATPDNTGGIRAAVDHLVSHGHRDIGFVGNLQQHDVRERYSAYREALAQRGLSVVDDWVFKAHDNQEIAGLVAGQHYLQRGRPTTATIAATDRNAIGFVKALRQAGMSLPAEHAVIGFDRSESGARLRPRLTTVDPHHDRVGELAARILLRQYAGETIATREHISESTLITRESCGCVESLPDRTMVGSQPHEGASASTQLAETARHVFNGPAAPGHPTTLHVGTWTSAMLEIISAAAMRAVIPNTAVLTRIADATTALHPQPEALESLLTALRAAEIETRATLDATCKAQLNALTVTMTRLTSAVTKGCTRALMNRSGSLEQMLSHQYEIDIALMRVAVSDPRTLSWLPATFKGGAVLAMWDRDGRGTSTGKLSIAGTRDVGSTGARLLGESMVAACFPPAVVTRAVGNTRSDILFVIPVTFAGSDWGYLAVSGVADTRSTSARDRFNHWAAMLAVALDHEQSTRTLREHTASLQQLLTRKSEVASQLLESEERHAIAAAVHQDGMWDWDVITGKVYYSPSWRQTIGVAEHESGASLETWTSRVHPEDRPAMQMAIAQQLAGLNEPFHLTQRVRDASGCYRHVAVRALTLLNDAGVPARIIGALSLVQSTFDDQDGDGGVEQDTLSRRSQDELADR
ncbi:substrate-binding domain-containing protein [Jonesia quinghaiensis]|uniref:substrate-binding domain-containing protein n=1 Tax=Jonesia quinghaiensis TaxID=262806 RepID=UPI00041813DB|nr:substrate-binding domain-containing protein [Jonesia quinghaiensis]